MYINTCINVYIHIYLYVCICIKNVYISLLQHKPLTQSRSTHRRPLSVFRSGDLKLPQLRVGFTLKCALQLLINRYGYIPFAHVPERVSTKSFVVLIIGNSKSFHLGAQGTFNPDPCLIFLQATSSCRPTSWCRIYI